jgi:surfeit locus 1 family protein
VYRFALRPRWIASHLLVLALVVLMVNFGFWQLRRLDEKRDRNDLLAERTTQQEVPIEDLVDPDDGYAVGGELAYRPASATGRYDAAEEVLVRNRTMDGRPGYWVLTPLELDTGDAVVVLRGWVPLAVGDRGAPVAEAPPPAGTVTVRGSVATTQERGAIGPRDAESGDLTVLSRADIARMATQSDHPLLPVLLQLESQEPPPAALPQPVEPPEPSEGPHLSYAVQWFIFSAIGLFGYPLVLRKVAHAKARDARPDTPDAVEVPLAQERSDGSGVL